MSLTKADEVTKNCQVFLSSPAWRERFKNRGVLTWNIEIHNDNVSISGLDRAGRERVTYLLSYERDGLDQMRKKEDN